MSSPQALEAKQQSSSSMPEGLEYRGESKPRNIPVAFLLTMLCPGLGYMYVGRLIRGLTINLLFILWVEIYVIAQSVLKFFPLLPFAIFMLSWFVFAAFAAFDVKSILRQEGSEDYLLKSYNHWLPYALMATLSFALPIAISVKVTAQSLWIVSAQEHSGMYPVLDQGDVVLIDRAGFMQRRPQLGDLVAVSSNQDGSPLHILRVVAQKDDIVRVEGDMLYINEEVLEQEPITLNEAYTLATQHDLLTYQENNRGHHYPITLAKRAVNRTSIPPTKIGDKELYMLTDNRSQVPLHDERAKLRDSRSFGPIGYDKLRGRPRYILWSSDPKTGKVRFDRIGLKLY